MFELTKLSAEGIARALEKVERYRLLNEPWEAESICRDVLDADPDNHEARVSLILSLTDQFGDEGGPSVSDVEGLLDRLDDEYDRAYYSGIICERIGKARMRSGGPRSGFVAYDWLRDAMSHYERAEKLSPADNDDAKLRWNSCARMIDGNPELRPEPETETEPAMLE